MDSVIKQMKLSNPRKFGNKIETDAQKFLEQHCLKLITKNFNCRFGEIDLIMQDKEEVVFVEVRYRNNDKYGAGLETIDRRKQLKLIKTAEFFLLNRHQKTWKEDPPCRFDVISASSTDCDTIDGNIEFDWIVDAFQH